MSDDVVRAAGGVVWRRVDDHVEILVVHRPRYDDWSLPKGKLDPGESEEEAALREVEEETGLRCELGAQLATVEYTDRKGRPKRVRYWAMRPRGDRSDGFVPDHEVDRVLWVARDDLASLLTYPHDLDVAMRLRMP